MALAPQDVAVGPAAQALAAGRDARVAARQQNRTARRAARYGTATTADAAAALRARMWPPKRRRGDAGSAVMTEDPARGRGFVPPAY